MASAQAYVSSCGPRPLIEIADHAQRVSKLVQHDISGVVVAAGGREADADVAPVVLNDDAGVFAPVVVAPCCDVVVGEEPLDRYSGIAPAQHHTTSRALRP